MRVLTARDLNRAVLARQSLLERSRMPPARMLERMGCLQAQYAPSIYLGLWSRLEDFDFAALTQALERRSVVQATLMRSTIHLVSNADYWPLALATATARRRQYERVPALAVPKGQLGPAMARLEAALADGPLARREVEALVGKPAARAANTFLHLVRVPPSGTWQRRSADLWGLATEWVGPPADSDDDDDDPTVALVRRYLTGFGPATRQEVANWCGMRVGDVAPALHALELRRFTAEDGAELLDLPRLPLPGGDAPAPVRLLPTWDATLLTHARRAGILRETDRERIFSSRNPHSHPTVLVDGTVEGTWRIGDGGRVAVDLWRTLSPAERAQLDAEVAALEAHLDERR